MLSGHFAESRYLITASFRNIFRNHECDGERKAKNGASITESIKSLFLPETSSDDLHRFPYKR